MSPKLTVGKINFGVSEAELRSRHSEDVQELKRKISSASRLLSEYRASHGSVVALFDAIKDSIPLYPSSKIRYNHISPNGKKAPVGVCLLICDSHYGAVQTPSEIEGFGEYSPKICETRSMKFIDEVVRWTNLCRRSYQIDRAHVLVAGDLISGIFILSYR